MIIKNRAAFGALFENMVIVDIMKNFINNGIKTNFTFYRDSNQNEIDLIIEKNLPTPIEIKASHSLDNKFFKTINWFAQQHSYNTPTVIYGGDHNQERTNANVISWQNLEKLIKI